MLRRAPWVFAVLLAVPMSAARPVDLAIPAPTQTVTLAAGELIPLPLQKPDGSREIVWALPYTLLNETGRDRDITVEFLMSTDVTRMVPVDVKSSDYAEEEITRPRMRFVPVRVPSKDHPLARAKLQSLLRTDLLPQVQMQGKIRSGERKTSAAFFEKVPLNTRAMQIYVFGLSKTGRVEINANERPKPDHYKNLLTVGAPVMRIASRPDPDTYELLSLAEEISEAVYKQMDSKTRQATTFQYNGANYKYSDPILTPPPGTLLLERWVRCLSFRRGGETLRAGGEHVEATGQHWIIGLSELTPPAAGSN